MNNPTSDWPVLIRSSVAGFDSTRDNGRVPKMKQRREPIDLNMNNMAKIAGCLVSIMALICGCQTGNESRSQEAKDEETLEMLTLAEMVASDKSGLVVFVVDIPPKRIEGLKKLCGPGHEIVSSDKGEWKDLEPISGAIPRKNLRVKGTDKMGYQIKVRIKEIRKETAETVGVGSGGSFGGSNLFRFSRQHGKWRVVSTEQLMTFD